MEIEIKNCNNIEQAKIEIVEGHLNIKYGANGTGKSTIAEALKLGIEGKELSGLKPFKADGTATPSITGIDPLRSVEIFNTEYVNQFVFKPDEVVSNSFEIFIKDSNHEAREREIEESIRAIKQAFADDEELKQTIVDFCELCASFGKSSSGFSKAGKLHKAIGKGNLLEHIPEDLQIFKEFLKSDNNVRWLKWQLEGAKFSEGVDDCPYCVSHIPDKKEAIQAVSQKYKPKDIEHLNKLQDILENLDQYFAAGTRAKLWKIVRDHAGLNEENISYLLGVKEEIAEVLKKLEGLQQISYFDLKKEGDASETIKGLKINLEALSYLSSPKTTSLVENINTTLDQVLEDAGRLKGRVNKHQHQIKKTIVDKHKKINDFLRYAGYRYKVSIKEDGKAYKMKLCPVELASSVDSAKHLSHGEKNAFALVLFMYHALSKNPDLIILDDPVSSFDEHKKFAIIEMLFMRAGTFRGQTVLMFTHDFEPVIDMVKTLKSKFDSKPKASFLYNNNGLIEEQKIESSDVQSFMEICENAARQEDRVNLIVPLIYLRRYFETLNIRGNEYHILSSLFKGKSYPEKKISREEFRPLSTEEIRVATVEIKKFVTGFNYERHVLTISDDRQLCSLYGQLTVNYEKLQVYRLISSGDDDNEVFSKFINETYHIENEYVMQLDPAKYNTVPRHVIEECDRRVAEIVEDYA